MHYLSETATAEYEVARRKVQRSSMPREDREVIFTSGTTDGINLVAHGYGRKFIGAGDEIMLTTLEHHSNIVPWQMLAEEKGARIRVVPINDRGELLDRGLRAALEPARQAGGDCPTSPTRSAPSTRSSEMIASAHRHGVPVLVDGAQADAAPAGRRAGRWTATSTASRGTRCAGRPGSGCSTARAALLEKMQPFKGGGDMILSVTFEKTTYNAIPHKFEAGTPPIAAVIGLGAAVDYLTEIGIGRDRRTRPSCSTTRPSR